MNYLVEFKAPFQTYENAYKNLEKNLFFEII